MAELGAEKAKRAGSAVAGMAASWQDRGLGKSTTIQVDFINLIASCNGRDWKVHRAAPLALPYCTVSSSSRNRRPYESERGDCGGAHWSEIVKNVFRNDKITCI